MVRHNAPFLIRTNSGDTKVKFWRTEMKELVEIVNAV